VKYCKADKSNTLIILDYDDYEILINKHLKNTNTYTTSVESPNNHTIAKIKLFSQTFSDQLTDAEKSCLKKSTIY